VSGPKTRRPLYDQKEIKAKLKELESRFHPWMSQQHRTDIVTRWIGLAGRLERQRIRSNKPVRARPKPNRHGSITPLLKMAKRLPQLPTKRVTWTRAKCAKKAQDFVLAGAPRERYFKKLMDALYDYPEPALAPVRYRGGLTGHSFTLMLPRQVRYSKLAGDDAFELLTRAGDEAPTLKAVGIRWEALGHWCRDKNSRQRQTMHSVLVDLTMECNGYVDERLRVACGLRVTRPKSKEEESVRFGGYEEPRNRAEEGSLAFQIIEDAGGSVVAHRFNDRRVAYSALYVGSTLKPR
jgi:hypothetical protein